MFKSFFDKFKKKEDQDSQQLESQIDDVESQEDTAEPVEIESETESLQPQVVIPVSDEDAIEIDEAIIPERIQVEDLDDENQDEALHETIMEEETPESQEVSDIEVEEEQKQPVSFLERLKKGLFRTRDNISSKIDKMLASYQKVDEDLFEELEEILISADIGVESTMEIMDQLTENVKLKRVKDPSEVKAMLVDIMKNKLQEKGLNNSLNVDSSPTIILVVGVNGVGKTTTIGKIAHKLKQQNKKVMLVAADTFRAAAIEQLTEWANRAKVEIITHSEGADPAAVIFDGIASAKAKGVDVLICDTAGRLHNKKNLMNELNKIHRVVEREFPNATKEVLLVVDGTTGQNAIYQAKEFKGAAELTGVVITKLDGTAKGGVVFPLELELDLPIKLIGIGEQIDNLVDFKPDDFIDAIVN